jgi:homoserine/homoserine lactone efflux protein
MARRPAAQFHCFHTPTGGSAAPLDTYLIYLAAVAIFFATPPDTSQLLILSNSIRHGLRRSVWTIAGDLTANLRQMSVAAFGLAAIIATSAGAFLWIKWLGVGYLAWIGLQMFFSKQKDTELATGTAGNRIRLFRQGFVTSMANPFAVVFFGALFAQFLDPGLPVLPQLIILGGTYDAVDAATLLLWGWIGIRAANLFRRVSSGLVTRVCGAMMLAAAALLASKEIEPARRPRRRRAGAAPWPCPLAPARRGSEGPGAFRAPLRAGA